MFATIFNIIGYAIEIFLLYQIFRIVRFILGFVFYFSPENEDYRFTSGHTKFPPLNSSEWFEYRVYRSFRKAFGKDARYISNAVIPTRRGSFTEVDLLVVSRYGLAIIEAKNYKCDLVVEFTRNEWEYPFGSRKQIASPLHQNEYHAKCLKNYILDHPGVVPERYQDCPYDAMYALTVFPDKTPIRFSGMRPELDCSYSIGSISSVIKSIRKDFKRDGEFFTAQEVDEMYYQMRSFYKFTRTERVQLIEDRRDGRYLDLEY